MSAAVVRIYILADPITGEIRYVGKTEQPLRVRLGAHIRKSRQRKTHRDCWITGLLSRGVRPEIHEIDRTRNDWEALERAWIARLLTEGHHLTNQTEGGEGSSGYRATPLECAAKAEITARNWSDPEYRAKVSAGLREAWRDPDFRERQTRARREVWADPAERKRRSAKMMEVCADLEYRALQSRSVAASWTPTRRAAQAEVARRVNADPARKRAQSELMARINRERAAARRAEKEREGQAK